MKKSFFRSFYQPNFGLLILRLGIGMMLTMHGIDKMFGGPEKWEKLGGAVSVLGIDFGLILWGFMAAFSEFVGGIFIGLGLLFRPMCILIFLTMCVAALKHILAGDDFKKYAHALELAILFFSIYFTGPGKYSIDSIFEKKDKPVYY
jgi:putative oxidoreductase